MDSTPTTFTSKLFIGIRRMTYVCLGFLPLPRSANSENVLVLCYHAVASDPWRFAISPEKMKKQIDLLVSKRQPVSLPELEAHVKGIKKIDGPAFAITFDDGYHDILAMKNYFQEKNIKPAVFVLAEPARVSRAELQTNRPFLSDQEILSLAAAGWTIGCHSATHPDFRTLDASGISREVIDSKKTLESRLGIPVDYFAYPKGVYSDAIAGAVRSAGYHLAFSMNDAFVSDGSLAFMLPRIGVDGTHSLSEFKALQTQLVVSTKNLIRRFI